jgi:hypothetical protein
MNPAKKFDWADNVEEEKKLDDSTAASAAEAPHDVEMCDSESGETEEGSGSWSRIARKSSTPRPPPMHQGLTFPPPTSSQDLREFGNQAFVSMCENLYNTLWDQFTSSGADCPSQFEFDLKLLSSSDVSFMIPAYTEYDLLEKRPKPSSPDFSSINTDEFIIQEAVANIVKQDSTRGIGLQRWQQLSEGGRKRALPFLHLFKSQARHRERKIFLDFAQEAHQKNLRHLPKIDKFSPKLKKLLAEENKVLLEKLKLWNPMQQPTNSKPNTKPTNPVNSSQASSRLNQRSAPIIPPKAGNANPSYASAVRKNSSNDDYTLFIYEGSDSRLALSEENFGILKRAIIKNNCHYMLDPTFDQDQIDFVRLVWKPSFGILSCSSQKSMDWFKGSLRDLQYTSGIICRGWSRADLDRTFIHFQIPKEFDLNEFNLIEVLQTINKRFAGLHFSTEQVLPARDNNKEAFLRVDSDIRDEILANPKIKMPWGHCTIKLGKPSQSFDPNQAKDVDMADLEVAASTSDSTPEAPALESSKSSPLPATPSTLTTHTTPSTPTTPTAPETSASPRSTQLPGSPAEAIQLAQQVPNLPMDAFQEALARAKLLAQKTLPTFKTPEPKQEDGQSSAGPDK